MPLDSLQWNDGVNKRGEPAPGAFGGTAVTHWKNHKGKADYESLTVTTTIDMCVVMLLLLLYTTDY